MTQTFTPQHLSPDAITQLVKHLPDYIKVALLEKSSELECSLEATIEMAIASFLLNHKDTKNTKEIRKKAKNLGQLSSPTPHFSLFHSYPDL